MRKRIGYWFVLAGMFSILLGLAVCLEPLAMATESFEEPMLLPSDEFEAAEGHLRLGLDFFLTNELDMAIDEFREAAHQKPDYADAFHNLGVALAKIGDVKGAITAWTVAERLDPATVSTPYSLSALVTYNYGVSLVGAGKLQEAIMEWQSALRLQPSFPEAHYALGLGFLALNNPVVAATHFQSSLNWAPGWEQAHAALGRAHYEAHEYDLARAAWQKTLTLAPNDARAYANLGLLAVQEGNNQQAIDYSRQAVALQPNLAPAHFNLGVALLANGKELACVESLEQTLDLDKRFTPARLLLGVAWGRLGNWSRAVHYWRQALHLDPFGPYTFWLHDHLGRALTSIGHIKDATKEFQWIVKHQPEWAQGWSQLGSSLMSERRWKEAVVALEKASYLQPTWAHLHFMRGNGYVEQGKLGLAVQAFREAIGVAPDFVEAQFHLGLVLRAQNHLSAAIEPLRQAAEGGSREAQGLLASMYVNGNGLDRNVPLAMFWWARSSREAIPDTITRLSKRQLAQLRRRLHRQQFSRDELQDVLTGFGLIRQDLANQAPQEFSGSVSLDDPNLWHHTTRPRFVLPWVIQRALALDDVAQNHLVEWYENGVAEKFPLEQSLLEGYWLQVAKEGDRVGCKVMTHMNLEEKFSTVRQACQSLSH